MFCTDYDFLRVLFLIFWQPLLNLLSTLWYYFDIKIFFLISCREGQEVDLIHRSIYWKRKYLFYFIKKLSNLLSWVLWNKYEIWFKTYRKPGKSLIPKESASSNFPISIALSNAASNVFTCKIFKGCNMHSCRFNKIWQTSKSALKKKIK